MPRRSGVTLVEVLVAIFVMGIGMIALLTLFPIGMLRMARAIHDQRSTDSHANAHSISLVHNIGNDLDVVSDAASPYLAAVPCDDLFKNPLPKLAAVGSQYLLDAPIDGASYPVFVDPIGFYNLGGQPKHWVGGFSPTSNVPPVPAQPGGALRRRPVEFVRNGLNRATPVQRQASDLRIFSSFTLWDDMVFEYALGANTPPGTPQSASLIAPFSPMRDSRFSWGYTLQRPQTGDRSIVDCSIVVFDNRSLTITGTGSTLETVYPSSAAPTAYTYFDPNKNTISIDYTTTAAPSLRPNDWILDVTPNPGGGAHCYWYRVVAAEDLVVGVRKIARFEVQQPIRGSFNPAYQVAGLGFQGTSIILDGVAEVFPKGPLRLP